MDINTITIMKPASRPSADVTAIVGGLRRIVRALELYSHEVKRDYGLTAPQLWALKTLAREGPLTVNQLAAHLHQHQSSASLLVSRLEQRGYVRRARSETDRRFVRIAPTEQALAVLAQAPEPAQGRLLHGLRRMPPTRLRSIRRSVEDLVGAMEAEGVEARFFFEEDA
ncbi:MAG TPA: MarR family transcriptional regulator [Gemmatimonadales bacterium]|nr:MarR family transcriptional regulator [Gemmatimonadales bacterium]